MLADPSTPYNDLLEARDELHRKMPGGSKTALGYFAKDLARVCCMGFAGPQMLTTILKVSYDARVGVAGLGLLGLLGHHACSPRLDNTSHFHSPLIPLLTPCPPTPSSRPRSVRQVAEKAAEEEEDNVCESAIRIVEVSVEVFPTVFEEIAPALFELYSGDLDSRLKTRLLKVRVVTGHE